MKVDDDMVIEIADLFAKGYGTSLISKQVGVAKSTVERVLYCQSPAAQRLIGRRLLKGRRPSSELARYATGTTLAAKDC